MMNKLKYLRTLFRGLCFLVVVVVLMFHMVEFTSNNEGNIPENTLDKHVIVEGSTTLDERIPLTDHVSKRNNTSAPSDANNHYLYNNTMRPPKKVRNDPRFTNPSSPTDTTMVDPRWWEDLVDDIAQPWTSWTEAVARTTTAAGLQQQHNNNDDPFGWCVVPGTKHYHRQAGLYFVKVPKAGSSTAAAVAIQMAQNVATRKGVLGGSCTHSFRHGNQYTHRVAPFFLWSVVRHPVSRIISEYFFSEVSRKYQPPTSRGMIAYISKKKSFQLQYLSLLKSRGNQPRYRLGRATREQLIEIFRKDILKAYHFLAVAERMDESMVVLQLLFQLAPNDMIVLSSKQAGGYDDGKFMGRCHLLKKAPKSLAVDFPHVDDYLQYDFVVQNHDFFLHALANRSLDLTIDALGRDRVEREVQRHKARHQWANQHCQSETISPCSSNGTLQVEASSRSCFFGDLGCGHDCVQRVLAKYEPPEPAV